MKVNRFTILLSALVLIFNACSYKRTMLINPDEIEQITIYSLGMGWERCSSIDIQYVISHGKDTTVKDQGFIIPFAREINKLRPNYNSQFGDYRTVAIVETINNASIVVAFGESFGTNCNGIVMQDRKSLFSMINRHIINTQPYDYWLDDTLKTVFHEINAIQTGPVD